MAIKAILLLSFIASLVESISVYSDGKKTKCFEKYFSKYENITMSYIVSGEKERNFKVNIINPNNNNIYESNYREAGKFFNECEDSGLYKLCFIPELTYDTSISFDFHGSYEKGHIINAAKGEALTDMQKDILSIQGLFEQIENNVKYLTERYSSHGEGK